MIDMWTKRCLGYHCPTSSDCRLWLRPVQGTTPFQAYPVGELCDFYDPVSEERSWGEGAEPND
jgi:hypothetical protein